MDTTDKRETSTERVRRFRQRRRGEYSRMEIYLSSKARVRLKRLSKAWKLSRPAVIERLIFEAADRPEGIDGAFASW
jgi:hypothetical protein